MRNSIQLREEEYFEPLLNYAKKAGFKEISISFGSGELIFKEDFEDKVYEIKELLDKCGISCSQTHLPNYHLLISSEETEEKTENAILNCLKASSILGAEWTAFHPRSDIKNGFDRKKSFIANQNDLNRYLEYAEKFSVGIAIENMPLYPFSRPEWRFFGGGWEEIVELCDSFNSEKIGICWDFGHAHTAALDQCKAIENIGERLKITHVHDNYKKGDHHQLPLLASTEWGSIEWDKIMKTMQKIKYTGPLTLEVIFPPENMLESFVRLGYDTLNHLKELSLK